MDSVAAGLCATAIGKPAFAKAFEHLTGHRPFRWQQRLYDCFVTGELPTALDLPTGLGKTSVMAIWLLAQAVSQQAGPRPKAERRRHVPEFASVMLLARLSPLQGPGEGEAGL